MKNGKAKIESVEGFVKLPRHVVDQIIAARLSLAAWRLLVFLIRELLRHGGRDNGQLEAPYRQLVAIGISSALIDSAIRELEGAGLVRCLRGRRRNPNLFELTWLPRLESHQSGRRFATSSEAMLPPDMKAKH